MSVIILRPAPPPPVPREIARWQFYRGLALSGLITFDEALYAVARGDIPATLNTIADGMTDEAAKFDAKMLLIGATSFYRDHPLVMIFAISQGMSEDAVDDFWRLCAGLSQDPAQ